MTAQAMSVCIPARNEENTIASTVLSALNQDFSGELEVLVCANACTDNTKRVVEELSAKHKNVRLLRSEPGKPNAWNELVLEASFDDLVFLDGDVVVKQGSFEAIQTVYDNGSEIYGVSGGCIKVLDDFSFLTKVFNLPKDLPPGNNFCGRLYSVKREPFFRMMNQKGYHKMPVDVINEDLWASLVLEIRNNNKVVKKYWKGTNNAKAYFKPIKIRDFLAEQIRIKEGQYQLANEHPSLNYDISQRLIRKLKQRVPEWYDKWKQLDNTHEKMIVPFVFISRKILYRALIMYADYKARESYFSGQATNLWKETRSSKTAFNEQALIPTQTITGN
ncbi:glycosyltransferase family 2 protein [Candidatus Woesearchaeota archaeon]|nr:glycosyltransferase family 2 protein [Candidatus Woesearchaeota archaeon]